MSEELYKIGERGELFIDGQFVGVIVDLPAFGKLLDSVAHPDLETLRKESSHLKGRVLEEYERAEQLKAENNRLKRGAPYDPDPANFYPPDKAPVASSELDEFFSTIFPELAESEGPILSTPTIGDEPEIEPDVWGRYDYGDEEC